MKVRRLGLFGGTFDPPHFGHVAALEAAARCGRFDRLLVTVAGDPYLKVADVRPAALRLAMAHAAFDDLALVDVSDLEIRRQGPSYTIDTVRALLDDVDAVDLIVGADLAAQLDHWHEADVLRDLVAVGIVPRPGSLSGAPEGWRCFEIPMEPVDLSSTYIREMLDGYQNLGEFLPASVIPLFEGARG
ncbi:MAG TPA: nicotinate-nucleotide adenylyltransferase [Acidimicrobiales bacterium]|nr:nicotinate-nucleotide adenylyltransferase [Acidimicrobiales bacterium]